MLKLRSAIENNYHKIDQDAIVGEDNTHGDELRGPFRQGHGDLSVYTTSRHMLQS